MEISFLAVNDWSDYIRWWQSDEQLDVDLHSLAAVIIDLLSFSTLTEIFNVLQECTMTYGKMKVVLKQSKYFLESRFPVSLDEKLIIIFIFVIKYAN